MFACAPTERSTPTLDISSPHREGTALRDQQKTAGRQLSCELLCCGLCSSSRLVEQVASKTRGVTAVDHDLLSGDVRCSVRRKKDGCAGEVARLSPTSQRDPAIEARDVLLAL
jgi:hypothetical protein